MKTTITMIAFSIVFVLFFAFIANIGIRKQEKLECERWASEAEQYENYYLTDWQVKQCQNY
jgi:hypothetical protein